MKKLLFILTLVVTITACNKKSHSVVGKWKPVEMNIKEMSDAEKKEMIDKTILEFTADGHFSTSRNNDKMEGTYTLDAKNDTMTVINAGEGNRKTQQFKISWEGNNLVMTNEEGVVKLKQ